MHTPVREGEALAKSEPHILSAGRGNGLTIEAAIQAYLQTHHKARHGPKTLNGLRWLCVICNAICLLNATCFWSARSEKPISAAG